MTIPRKSALSVLLLASTLVVMAGSILTPVLELIRSDLGVTGTAAGLIITAHGLAIAVTSPLVGWMIDRWGVRWPLAGGLVLYGIAGGAGLLTTSYPALLASRFVFGLGAAAVFSGTTVAILALYQGPERDRVMGWRGTATSLGGVIWPLLGGAVGGLSWHAPFAVYLIGVPLGLAAVLTLPADSAVGSGESKKFAGTWWLLRNRPMLLVFLGLQIVTSILMYVLVVFLPQRLAQVGIGDPFVVSLYNVVMAAVMSIVGLVYGRMRASFDYDMLLRTTLGCWAVAFLILGTSGAPFLMILAPALIGLGQGIMVPAITALVGETAPVELRGQAAALLGTATFAGQFMSPILLGPIVGVTSISIGFLASAGLSAVVLVLLLTTRMSRHTAREVPEQPAAEPAGSAK